MQVSVENAVVLQCTKQVPLIMDPSAQVTSWIVKHQTARSTALEVTTPQHPRFATALELAVRFGKVWPFCNCSTNCQR